MKRLALLLLLLSVPLASADEPAKVGKIQVSAGKDAPNRAIFEVWLQPAYEDNRLQRSGEVLPDFTEKDIIIGGKKTALKVTFDRAGVYKYKLPKLRYFDFIHSVKLEDRKGSYSNPDQIYTDNGKEIRSAELSIRAKSGVFYQFLEMDRSQGNALIVRFAIQRIVSTDSALFKPIVSVDMTEIDTQASVTVNSTLGQSKLLSRLDDFPDQTFVTLLYPLKHIQPERAKSIIENKLSLLGKLGLDNENTALLITDRADYVRSLVESLALIDKPQPQVLIEVKILEVAWENRERLGFHWGVQDRSIVADQGGTFQKGRFASAALRTASGHLGPVAGGSSFVFGKVSTEMARQVQSQIDMLSQKGRVSLLAAPKLRVVNNRTATFHAGSSIPVLRHNSVVQTNDVLEARTLNAIPRTMELGDTNTRTVTHDRDRRVTSSEQTVDTGVKLTVTPQITGSDEIVLTLTPSVSEIGGWREGTGQPVINTREITTTVKVRDNEDVMIAGLFKEKEGKGTSGVPGLSKVPALGRLFRTEEAQRQKTETVFLLHIQRQ
ncbi:MAG: type II secretion system protein GspD [Planctomycetota bacterium]|jgi:type II secretory pathway component GspD/PulD (secretin)